MKTKLDKRQEAIRLRHDERLSLLEIAFRLKVAKSSVSTWVRKFPLTKEELRNRRYVGKPVPTHQVGECLECGMVFNRRRPKTKFCSAACRQAAKAKRVIKPKRAVMIFNRNTEQLALWKAGTFQPSERQVKRLLKFERVKLCSVCGWAEVNPHTGTIPVELEHIDGDCYNNAYSNVAWICPNHHSLTSTYRGANANKGRGRKFYKLVTEWAKNKRETGFVV